MQISWKRNFYLLWLAQAAAVIGFQSVQPSLPYYVQELGVVDLSEAAVWAGYMGTASGLAMALSAPVCGEPWPIASDDVRWWCAPWCWVGSPCC